MITFLREFWNGFKEDVVFILETKEEATKRRQQEAVLTVFGRMDPGEQQAFRGRGGVLPGEPEWLDPGSPEWHATFTSGGPAGRRATIELDSEGG